ncbi:MAG: TauD/TfdA family dioxygenase [Acinetobacter sp.]|nr:TauD/TfdA family dioxygenase [Acinetobacter sp.]
MAPNFAKSDALIEDAEFLKQIDLICNELENGYGFIVIRGLDAEKYNEYQLANIYYLIGLHMGNSVTQNARGDLMGYVENIGDKNQKMTRVYQTNSYLPYHADLSDVVGLLSIRKAKEGGLSSIVSSSTVYNRILAEYPEYLGYFYHPAWYDHLGETEPSLSPIFSYFDGKLACRYLRYYIELGHDRRSVPLSQVQIDALNIFDHISQDSSLRLDMMLEPGDIQFCNNYCVMHSRSSFEDYDEVEKRRKLLRLWLKMPNARKLAKDFPGRNGIPKGLGEVA